VPSANLKGYRPGLRSKIMRPPTPSPGLLLLPSPRVARARTSFSARSTCAHLAAV